MLQYFVEYHERMLIMIISFFGHSLIYRDKILETILKETIKKHKGKTVINLAEIK